MCGTVQNTVLYLKAFKEQSSKMKSIRGTGAITPEGWCSYCEIEADLKHLKTCQVSQSRSTLYLHLSFLLVICSYSNMIWLTHHRSPGSSQRLLFFPDLLLLRATLETMVLVYFPLPLIIKENILAIYSSISRHSSSHFPPKLWIGRKIKHYVKQKKFYNSKNFRDKK